MDLAPVLLSCLQHLFVFFSSLFCVNLPLVVLTFTALSFTCADISLFDDLDDLGDADELLEALVESVGYVSQNRFITNLFFLEWDRIGLKMIQLILLFVFSLITFVNKGL